MSRNHKQYTGAFGRAKKLTAPCIVVHPYGGLCNALSAIQGGIIAGTLLDKKVYVQWDSNRAAIPNIEWHDLFKPPQAFELSPLFSVRPSINNLMRTFISTSISIRLFVRLLKYLIKLALLLLPLSYLKKYIKAKINATLDVDRLFIEKWLSRWHGFDADIRGFQPGPANPYIPKKRVLIDFSVYQDKQYIYFKSYYNIFNKHYDKPLPPHLGHYDFFKPTVSLQKRIDAITRSFNDSTIGVHIRRTDPLGSIQCVRYSPTTVFIKAMHQAIALNPDTLFYIASDDANEIKAMQAIFGTRIITQHNTDFNRYTKGGMHGAVIDLFCLSKTQRIIGSFKSSFGRVAAKIGRIDFKQCIIDQQ